MAGIRFTTAWQSGRQGLRLDWLMPRSVDLTAASPWLTRTQVALAYLRHKRLACLEARNVASEPWATVGSPFSIRTSDPEVWTSASAGALMGNMWRAQLSPGSKSAERARFTALNTSHDTARGSPDIPRHGRYCLPLRLVVIPTKAQRQTLALRQHVGAFSSDSRDCRVEPRRPSG